MSSLFAPTRPDAFDWLENLTKGHVPSSKRKARKVRGRMLRMKASAKPQESRHRKEEEVEGAK